MYAKSSVITTYESKVKSKSTKAFVCKLSGRGIESSELEKGTDACRNCPISGVLETAAPAINT